MSIVSQGLGLRLDKHLGIIVALGYGIDELVPAQLPNYVYGCAKDYITASAAVDRDTGSTLMERITMSTIMLSIVDAASSDFAGGGNVEYMEPVTTISDFGTVSEATDFNVSASDADRETLSEESSGSAEATDRDVDATTTEGLIHDLC